MSMKSENNPRIFRRSKWRKLLKERMCRDCSLSCAEHVECNPIEEILDKFREELRK